MLYQLIAFNNDLIENLFNKSLKEVDSFFNLNWVVNKPKLIIVNDREQFNYLLDRKTNDWVVGSAFDRFIFILNPINYEKESCHKFNINEYKSLIKHELTHLFFNALSDNHYLPLWLYEGVSILVSGQLAFKPLIVKFNSFINYFNKTDHNIYSESGFAVKLLVDNFGKRKLLSLIKGLKNVNTKRSFNQLFNNVYGFKPSLVNFNKLLN